MNADATGFHFACPARIGRQRLAALLVAGGLGAFLAACDDPMKDQPAYRSYGTAELFDDGKVMQHPPEGTVARGDLEPGPVVERGIRDGAPVEEIPVPVDASLVRRGEEMFNAHCAVCHGYTGKGDGMVVQRGYPKPQSFHQDRLRESPPGYFYNAIRNGFGRMPADRKQVRLEDRWAIVAYIEALQLSQHARLEALPESWRESFRESPGQSLSNTDREGAGGE